MRVFPVGGEHRQSGRCDAMQRFHLKDRECGQMGVKRMAGTLGWTMDPPAATE